MPGKVLIAVGNGIGNIIQTTPAIEAIASLGYKIDLVATHIKFGWEILQGWGKIDHYYKPDEKNQMPIDDYEMFIPTLHAWANHFSGQKPSMMKLFSPRLARIGTKNDTEINMDIARALGYTGDTPHTHVEYDKKLYRKNKAQFSSMIGIHMGCKNKPKWRGKKWIYWRQLFKNLPDHQFALFGGPDEGLAGQPLDNVFDFTGKTEDIRDTAALIKCCRLFVSNDSGLMHIASALGVPTIGIFGMTDPMKCTPLDPNFHLVKTTAECAPCQYGSKWQQCRLECMHTISVNEVRMKIEEVLGDE